jgi:hypothetical protein
MELTKGRRMNDPTSEIFVDTACWIALLNHKDSFHISTNILYQDLMKKGSVFITTSSIIEETANALSNPKFRESLMTFYHNICRSPRVTILHIDPELWEKGWRLFTNRNDKSWSFTDCVSFVVMNERNIKNALTSDKHFIQAGFSAMLQN